jgi:hypothetical protein
VVLVEGNEVERRVRHAALPKSADDGEKIPGEGENWRCLISPKTLIPAANLHREYLAFVVDLAGWMSMSGSCVE